MTIRVARLDEDVNSPQPVIIRVAPEDWNKFQELIQRGSNLWPDAPPAIKEFADVVTSGRVLQDYSNAASNQLNTDPERK